MPPDAGVEENVMKSIEFKDLLGLETVAPAEAADVKGGPIYIEYEGIKGDVQARSTPKLAEAVADGTL